MELIITGDGSHTLFSGELDETYHSKHGAIRESMHVFIRNGFRHYLSISGKNNLRVFELGLGTGLNALLTAMEAGKFRCPVWYEAVEPYPLGPDIYRKLNFTDFLPPTEPPGLLLKIHESGWEGAEPLTGKYTQKKARIRFEDYETDNKNFDIIYYDAFAPGKQPEIWAPGLIRKAHDMLLPGGILVTYCAQGNFKRNLREAGFRIESLTGPPGKKEMVRAVR